MPVALATSQGQTTALFTDSLDRLALLRPLVEAAKTANTAEDIAQLRREWTHRCNSNSTVQAHPEFEVLRRQLFESWVPQAFEPHYKSIPTWISAL